MKLVINKCYGGFSLSPKAVKRMAELQGRECYFFTSRSPEGKYDLHKHFPISLDEAGANRFFFTAYDVPNPDEVLAPYNQSNWHDMSSDEQKASNEAWEKRTISIRPDDRTDPILVQAVEELGDDANGSCAKLRVVEIPDGTEYELDEYDGIESIHEVHQSWG